MGFLSRIVGALGNAGLYRVKACRVTLDQFWRTGVPVTLAYPLPMFETSYPSTISRSTIAERNKELRAKIGPVSPRQRLTNSLARWRKDHALRGYDAALRQSLRDNYTPLFRQFRPESA